MLLLYSDGILERPGRAVPDSADELARVAGRAATAAERVGIETVELLVPGHGRWREPARRSARGRGLALTAQLVDDVRVEPTGCTAAGAAPCR